MVNTSRSPSTHSQVTEPPVQASFSGVTDIGVRDAPTATQNPCSACRQPWTGQKGRTLYILPQGRYLRGLTSYVCWSQPVVGRLVGFDGADATTCGISGKGSRAGFGDTLGYCVVAGGSLTRHWCTDEHSTRTTLRRSRSHRPNVSTKSARPRLFCILRQRRPRKSGTGQWSGLGG